MRGYSLDDWMDTPAGRRNADSIRAQLADNDDPQPKKKTKTPKVSGEIHDEALFFHLLQERGLPVPEKEYEFDCTFGQDGKPRKWRNDYYFPKTALVIEVQGGIWLKDAKGRAAGGHSTSTGIVGDMEKFNRMAAAGIRVLQFTPTTLNLPASIDLIHETYYGGWEEGTCACFDA